MAESWNGRLERGDKRVIRRVYDRSGVPWRTPKLVEAGYGRSASSGECHSCGGEGQVKSSVTVFVSRTMSVPGRKAWILTL